MQWYDWWCYQHHVMHSSTNSIIWPKKSCCTSVWLSWPKKWVVLLILPFSMRWHLCQWHHMTKKVILHLICIVLSWQMQLFHWWSYQHHVMLLVAPMASHDQESPIALHFNWLDLRNASYDTNASGNCVMRPKKDMLLLILIVLT